MTKREPRWPFAEVVREVLDAPAPRQAETGGVRDPSGTYWVQSKEEISPDEALTSVSDGALVAYDPCGCGGSCGFRWFTPDELTRLLRSGAPVVRRTKRHRGNLSEWVSADGGVLVVAEDAVRWADLLDP